MKIVIIEDDELSLELLKEMIETYFPSDVVSGTFVTSEDALEFLENTKADAIITDIKLPGMDGVEFSKICTNKYPDIPIIILSAYSDFKYAQELFNTTVVGYILKPITYDNFSAELDKIRKRKSQFFSTETIKAYSDFFRKYFFDEINSLASEVTKLPANNKVKLKYVAVISLKIFDYEKYIENVWHHGRDKLIDTINNILCSIDGEMISVIFLDEHNKFNIACVADDIENYANIDKIPMYLLNTLKISSSITPLLKMSKIEEMSENLTMYQLNKKLFSSIDSEEGISIETEGLGFDELQQIAGAMSQYIMLCYGMDDNIDMKVDLFDYQNITSECEMREYIGILVKYIKSYRKISCKNSIEKAIKYIEYNYSQKLTLETIAGYVAFSPKYFSRIFKEVVGKSVTEYIDEFRIRKAVDIIKKDKDIKTSNLSLQLGYSDYSTFYRNFKKYMGKTANQFINEVNKMREGG